MQPEADYHSLRYVSQSSIKDFIKSPVLYKHIHVDGNRGTGESSNMSLGTLVHTLLLEPNTFKFQYMVLDEGERPSPGQTFAAAVNKNWRESKVADAADTGRKLISQSLYEVADGMVQAVCAHKLASSFLFPTDGGWDVFTEKTILWKYSCSDVELKSKLDRILVNPRLGKAIILDYKTTTANNLMEFGWSVKKYGYDIQDAFYVDAVESWLEEQYPGIVFDIHFYFIPQKTTIPYQVLGVIQLDEQTVQAAREKYTMALMELEGCLHTNVWEQEEVITLRLSGDVAPTDDEVQLP